DGKALITDFYLHYPRFLSRMGALEEAAQDILCQRIIDAAGDDDLKFEWDDALTTASWATGSMDIVQKHAYEYLRNYADRIGMGT
ncbi:MAG: hypothetical protein RRY95_03870, partial [Oscillospiraceae bacterium]